MPCWSEREINHFSTHPPPTHTNLPLSNLTLNDTNNKQII